MDNYNMQRKIKRIIHENFLLDEKYSIFQEINSVNSQLIDETFSRLISSYVDPIKLIEDVEKLGLLSFYSFKRIYLAKGEKEILFCCSSISAKKIKMNEKENAELSKFDDSSTSSCCSSEKINKQKRNSKRENINSCPMRLKFKFINETSKYEISEDSNFNHNHSPISDSLENYKKKSQSIKFPLEWILYIFTKIFEFHKKFNNVPDKFLNQVRKNLIEEEDIKFESKDFKTNFCKKLIYMIRKIRNIFTDNLQKISFENIFHEVIKLVLLRGANYLKQEKLHSLNNICKKSSDSYDFYDKFKKLIFLEKP